MAEEKITRNYYIPFLDTTRGASDGVYEWARIDKSTVFELAANAQTEDYTFIYLEADQTELTSYKPSMEQEIACYRGNPMYDFIFDLFYHMDVKNAVVPALLVYPKLQDEDTTLPAWLYDEAQVVLGSLNSVDGKITFTINFNGERQLGTVTVTEGKPVFTAAVVTP